MPAPTRTPPMPSRESDTEPTTLERSISNMEATWLIGEPLFVWNQHSDSEPEIGSTPASPSRWPGIGDGPDVTTMSDLGPIHPLVLVRRTAIEGQTVRARYLSREEMEAEARTEGMMMWM
ncbi:hypothetical protein CDD80_2836 [Ophiocordyceps camponoti-rufipedis]|uniref:Uncharacterized protein n=1 Tax=Ophiocordyceps camponoti-rufipedis TaxID=2004952 RepID=A0A2C5Z4M8_9HYPO|nr:hypothetical protein CDD80_2836 [Ophiocordyceps camponoti-rufipedis]